MNQIFYITIYMSVKEKGNPEKGVCRVHMDIHNPNGIQKLLDELPEAFNIIKGDMSIVGGGGIIGTTCR